MSAAKRGTNKKLGTIKSVNTGTAKQVAGTKKPSGIHKEPQASIHVVDPGPRRVSGSTAPSGVAGDFIGNRRHHGGDDQAVYAYAREELDHWERVLGREIADGFFGENLTTLGLEVDAAVVGERWRIGDVLLEVCGPRVPCQTFTRQMQVPGWVKRFTEHGRTGAYLKVLTPGELEPGQEIAIVHRPGHGVTVPDYFRALMGDRALAARIVELGIVPEHRAAKLRR